MPKLFSVLFLSLLSSFGVNEDARVKAMFMYKIVQSMEWPTDKSPEKYVIAVLGDVNVLEQAKEVTRGRTINKKAIEVVNYTSDIELKEINVLFLSRSLSDLFESFHQKAIENSVLLVTESPGLAKKGAGINFSSNDKKLKFEMNLETLSQSQINSSRSIRDLAEIVD